ncbi:MAG: SPOR domain-containing protein [Polyangiaceae bacterium]|nr:SPOR domain-containing protein [Polyangiaceae bacterium]
MSRVNVRNLDDIQEQEPTARSSRLGAALLFAVGGTAIVTALALAERRQGPPARSSEDPLAALVAEAKTKPAPAAGKLAEGEVSFPGVLSDGDRPTTALAAVKDERGTLVAPDALVLPPGSPTTPPLASDRLPVVPLPAGALLGATPVTTAPKDPLAQLAAGSSTPSAEGALAPPGADGGYQIQVASFKTQPEADAFVQQLRARGHSAWRQAAYVKDRGLWHRVRVGPFKTKYEAQAYKTKFEQAEGLSPFVIDPHKLKMEEEVREAKRAARVKKYGRE